jgi:hypothetical protein
MSPEIKKNTGLHAKCTIFLPDFNQINFFSTNFYRGADKSLARPGRKQATATEDFYFHMSYL